MWDFTSRLFCGAGQDRWNGLNVDLIMRTRRTTAGTLTFTKCNLSSTLPFSLRSHCFVFLGSTSFPIPPPHPSQSTVSPHPLRQPPHSLRPPSQTNHAGTGLSLGKIHPLVSVYPATHQSSIASRSQRHRPYRDCMDAALAPFCSQSAIRVRKGSVWWNETGYVCWIGVGDTYIAISNLACNHTTLNIDL